MDASKMELIGYDKNFNPVTHIPFINLQWKRRYYEVGSFALQILAEDYDPNIKYVYSQYRPELGIVERMETETTLKGDFVNLSGRFIECIYDRQISYPTVEGEYSVHSLSLALNHEVLRPDLYNILEGNIPHTERIDVKWEKEELGTAYAEAIKTLELSYNVNFDPDTKRLTFNVWQGKDRTQAQSRNSWAVFSDDSAYVTSFSYIEDESGYKNAAMVLYDDPNSNTSGDKEPVIIRDDVYTGNYMQEGRRWIVVDGDAEDTAEVRRQKALEELQSAPLVQEAKVDVIQVGLLYLQDYDLGDKCQLVSKRYKKDFSARITSIDEVWKHGKHEVKLGFGEQTKTKYRRLRRYVKRFWHGHRRKL